jgi:hypothetical protein
LASSPLSLTYEWDLISDKGELAKGGWAGQLVYINRDKDVVVAWFGTNQNANPPLGSSPAASSRTNSFDRLCRHLNGNFSPRRMIKQTATTQTHMSDSLHIAAETVSVGEKYKTACRTTISANRAIASPTQVIGDARC